MHERIVLFDDTGELLPDGALVVTPGGYVLQGPVAVAVVRCDLPAALEPSHIAYQPGDGTPQM